MSEGPRVGYLVSRFPAASETFVIREMDAVAATGVELRLFSLFDPGDAFLHPSAERWAELARRPRVGASLASLARHGLRSPVRTSRIVATVVARTWRRPAIMARSLVTTVLAFGLLDLVREAEVDHVHAHFASYPALAALVGRLAGGPPFSFTAHAYDIFVDQSTLREKVAGAGFVATISDFNREFIERHAGGTGTPVEVVRAGLDPSLYEFQPSGPPASGPVRALCVASLQEKKGHAVLFEALAGSEALARVELDLIGGGELRGELEERAAALGLADRVRFHGARTEAEVRAALAAADLFVLPSIVAGDGQMEGVPVALMEALACGVPVVASRMSGIPELVRDERIGILAEPGDPGSLAAALERALENPFDPPAGRALVESEFDVRVSGERMSRLFRSDTTSPRR